MLRLSQRLYSTVTLFLMNLVLLHTDCQYMSVFIRFALPLRDLLVTCLDLFVFGLNNRGEG